MSELKAGARTLLPRLRRSYPWVDHLARAKDAFSERYGKHYAAAITYFSVLSLFPMLMVAFAVAGFVLSGKQATLERLQDSIVTSAPEGLQDFLTAIIKAALSSSAGIGIFGLLVALYSGLAWMTNLRDALTAQWGQEKKPRPFLSTKVKDLFSLIGLGAALLVSFGITVVGGYVGSSLLHLAGLAGNPWAEAALRAATIVLALVADVVVFVWMLSQLPREKVTVRSALNGAIVAAIGFEVLKIGAGYYLARVFVSPAGALFGPIIGLLVFANLVARFLLFITAWTATARENIVTTTAPPPPAVIRPTVRISRGPGLGVAAAAFGVGALLGRLARRRRA